MAWPLSKRAGARAALSLPSFHRSGTANLSAGICLPQYEKAPYPNFKRDRSGSNDLSVRFRTELFLDRMSAQGQQTTFHLSYASSRRTTAALRSRPNPAEVSETRMRSADGVQQPDVHLPVSAP